MDKAISILSGGIDSAVSTAIARDHHELAMAITFDYGQRALKAELDSASHLCKEWGIEHKIVRLDFLANIGKSSLTSKTAQVPEMSVEELENDPLMAAANAEQVWVPNRNGIFINVTAAISEARDFQWIITGFNREEAETYPDNSARYIELMNNCLAQSTLNHPQVISYVKDMDKTAILNAACEKKIEIDRLWCCYDGGDQWCGRCESCSRTIRAMKNLKLIGKYKKYFKTDMSD